jgi:hypothetical protein
MVGTGLVDNMVVHPQVVDIAGEGEAVDTEQVVEMAGEVYKLEEDFVGMVGEFGAWVEGITGPTLWREVESDLCKEAVRQVPVGNMMLKDTPLQEFVDSAEVDGTLSECIVLEKILAVVDVAVLVVDAPLSASESR